MNVLSPKTAAGPHSPHARWTNDPPAHTPQSDVPGKLLAMVMSQDAEICHTSRGDEQFFRKTG